MALLKTIKSAYGAAAPATYHMIADMAVSNRDMSATVRVASYIDADTRTNEKAAIVALKDAANASDETASAIARGKLAENQPIAWAEVGIPTEVFNTLGADDDGDLLRSKVYEHLKTLPRFSGAQNV